MAPRTGKKLSATKTWTSLPITALKKRRSSHGRSISARLAKLSSPISNTGKYTPTLACLLNGHLSCSGVNGEDRCKYDSQPYSLWQVMHCSLCGYVRMFEPYEDGKERWEPVDGF